MTTPNVVDEKYELESPVHSTHETSSDKKDIYSAEEHEQVEIDEKPQRHPIFEEFQFTWRASIIGSLLGCLVGKVNKNSW